MYPSDLMISPDPVPLPPLPLAEIVTTEGMTWSATEMTLHTLTWADPAELDVVLLDGDAEDLVAATITPPITPPTTSAAPSATHGSHPRLSRPCFDPFIPAPCYSVSPKPPPAVGVLPEFKQCHAQPASPLPGDPKALLLYEKFLVTGESLGLYPFSAYLFRTGRCYFKLPLS
jgi:hypothetical protein